jgi:hypothetical protein
MEVKILSKRISDSLVSDGVVEYDRVIAYPGEAPCVLNFKGAQIPEIICHGFDIFDGFCKLRKSLEHRGWQILCNGSLVNAFPFGQSRSMGGGFKLYLLELGVWPTRDNLIKIFDYTESQNLGTVDEQFNFYQQWLDSVGQRDFKEVTNG